MSKKVLLKPKMQHYFLFAKCIIKLEKGRGEQKKIAYLVLSGPLTKVLLFITSEVKQEIGHEHLFMITKFSKKERNF